MRPNNLSRPFLLQQLVISIQLVCSFTMLANIYEIINQLLLVSFRFLGERSSDSPSVTEISVGFEADNFLFMNLSCTFTFSKVQSFYLSTLC